MLDFNCIGIIHGDMGEHLRAKVIKSFRNGLLLKLISTDCIPEGIDMPCVLVINYELPIKKETYINRIGRACGFGR